MQRTRRTLLTLWCIGLPCVGNLLSTALCRGADRVTTQQLGEITAAAIQHHVSGKSLAARIDDLEPAERIGNNTAQELSRNLSPDVKLALRKLAARSAFLPPPESQIVHQPPPGNDEVKAMLIRASAYITNYLHQLPDFMCTETLNRFDDSAFPKNAGGSWIRLRLKDTLEANITFRNGHDSRSITRINGRSPKKGKQLLGMTNQGEFGNILGAIFHDRANGAWGHWEVLDGRQVAVFTYSIPAGRSSFILAYENTRQAGSTSQVTTAYSGLLSMLPDTGEIVRVTREADHIPSEFPMRVAATAISYAPVLIGGKPYALPAESITLSDTVLFPGEHGEAIHIDSLNTGEFTGYRKFATESTLTFGDAPTQQ